MRIKALLVSSTLLVCLIHFYDLWMTHELQMQEQRTQVEPSIPPTPSTLSLIAEKSTGSHALLYVHIEKCGGTSFAFGLNVLGERWGHGHESIFADHKGFGGLLMSDFLHIYQGGTPKKLVAQKWVRTHKPASNETTVRVENDKMLPKPIAVSCHENRQVDSQWQETQQLMQRIWLQERIVLLTTSLREPAARVVSHWMHFSRGNLTHPNQLPLSEWAAYVESIGGLYVDSFGSVPRKRSMNQTEMIYANQIAVKSAVSTLKNSFDFVFRTECVGQAISLTTMLIDEDDVGGIRDKVKSTKTLPRINASVNTAKERGHGKLNAAPLKEEYEILLRSPREGGLVLDHLVWDGIFGDHDEKCDIGTALSSGIYMPPRTFEMLLRS